MTAPVLAEKQCTKCGETKPLSGFHRNRNAADGHGWWCRSCNNEAVKNRQAQKRAEMGEEAWLKHNREITRRSRERNGMAAERAYAKAARQATSALVDRHRQEYEHLLLLARRGELVQS